MVVFKHWPYFSSNLSFNKQSWSRQSQFNFILVGYKFFRHLITWEKIKSTEVFSNDIAEPKFMFAGVYVLVLEIQENNIVQNLSFTLFYKYLLTREHSIK